MCGSSIAALVKIEGGYHLRRQLRPDEAASLGAEVGERLQRGSGIDGVTDDAGRKDEDEEDPADDEDDDAESRENDGALLGLATEANDSGEEDAEHDGQKCHAQHPSVIIHLNCLFPRNNTALLPLSSLFLLSPNRAAAVQALRGIGGAVLSENNSSHLVII